MERSIFEPSRKTRVASEPGIDYAWIISVWDGEGFTPYVVPAKANGWAERKEFRGRGLGWVPITWSLREEVLAFTGAPSGTDA